MLIVLAFVDGSRNFGFSNPVFPDLGGGPGGLRKVREVDGKYVLQISSKPDLMLPSYTSDVLSKKHIKFDQCLDLLIFSERYRGNNVEKQRQTTKK